MGQRFHLVPAVHVLMFSGESLLMLRRANTGYEDGKLSVPAGHVDGNEPVTVSAMREVREELGIDAAVDGFQFAHVMHRRKPDGEERVDFFLALAAWSGEPVNAEPHKCSELVWAERDSLPPDVIPYVRHAVESARSNIRFSEFGWS